MTETTVPQVPLSKGRLIGGILLLMLAAAFVLNAFGINATSSGAWCDSTRRDIYNGRASLTAIERYHRDCD